VKGECCTMQIVEVLISNGLPISVRFKIGRSTMSGVHQATMASRTMSYGPPWAHYLGGYQDRLLGRPLGLLDLGYTAPVGMKHKDLGGEVLG
jgi:hypothetical protein